MTYKHRFIRNCWLCKRLAMYEGGGWVVTSLHTEGGGWSLACIQRGWVVLKPGSRAYVLYELPLFQSGTELLSTSGRDDRHSRLGVFFLIHLNSLITQHCHSAY